VLIVAVLAAAVAVLVWGVAMPGPVARPVARAEGSAAPGHARRTVTSIAAGCGAWVVVGGPLGVAAGVVAGWMAHRVLAAAEPASVRRARDEAQREMPHLVDLLAATLQSGHAPMAGLAVTCAALPGPAAERLRPVLAHASLGGTPASVWQSVADDDVLAPLGRALARSQRTGASVVEAVEMLAEELEREANALAEDRARRVGVVAAIPLGICLLPAFVLIGIVPTVAVMLSTVTR
jgi:hypothetical protein